MLPLWNITRPSKHMHILSKLVLSCLCPSIPPVLAPPLQLWVSIVNGDVQDSTRSDLYEYIVDFLTYSTDPDLVWRHADWVLQRSQEVRASAVPLQAGGVFRWAGEVFPGWSHGGTETWVLAHRTRSPCLSELCMLCFGVMECVCVWETERAWVSPGTRSPWPPPPL